MPEQSTILKEAESVNIESYFNLTQCETEALQQEFNFSNAFNQLAQTTSQLNVIYRLPDLWLETEQFKQQTFNDRFLDIFYTIRGIKSGLTSANVMMHYSASIAIVHIANYLSKKGLSVSLIEPCFDSIFDVLKNQGVQVFPLQEELFYDGNTIYERLKFNVQTDAIFLVDPNNPTGFTTLGTQNKKLFNEIIRFCKDYDKILIIDHCFATFLLFDSRVTLYDTYQVLEDSGIKYMVIEDTGKFWPVQSTKVSILNVSKSLYREMYEIYNGYLLNVSPFVLNFLSAYILESSLDEFSAIRTPLARNRSLLRESLQGQGVKLIDSFTQTSVAWCEIQNPHIKATDLQRFLREHKKVYILPGTFFYWNEPRRGEKYLRIALARNTENFMRGMALLVEGLEEFSKQTNS